MTDQRARRGFLEEAALGLAEAVRGDPVFAAVVLVGSTLFLRDARWDVGAMFLAGACVARCSWRTRWLVFLAMAGVARGLDSNFAVREWTDIDLMAPVFTTTPRYLRVSVLLIAGGAGMRVAGFAIIGAALGIAAPLVRREGVEMSWQLAWSGASLGLAALGALRRRRAGLAIGIASLVAGGIASYETSGWAPSRRSLAESSVGAATEIAFVLWPLLAGLAAREIRESRVRDDPARLLTLVQRRPWPALSLVAAFLIFYGAPSFPLGALSLNYDWSLHSLAALCLGSTLLACLAAGSRAALGGLVAPLWLSTAVFTVWVGANSSSNGTALEASVVVQTTLATLGPLVLVRGVRDPVPGWVTSWALPALLAVLATQPAFVTADEWEYASFGSAPSWLWLALAPIAFQAATRVAVSPRRIVLLSVALGLASWLALLAGGARTSRYECASSIGVWFLGGVYVVIARRARTMSAVPLDHAVVADHGGS